MEYSWYGISPGDTVKFHMNGVLFSKIAEPTLSKTGIHVVNYTNIEFKVKIFFIDIRVQRCTNTKIPNTRNRNPFKMETFLSESIASQSEIIHHNWMQSGGNENKFIISNLLFRRPSAKYLAKVDDNIVTIAQKKQHLHSKYYRKKACKT